MACCGRQRTVPTGRPGLTPAGPAGPGGPGGSTAPVRLRWRRRVTASVSGPVTGTDYPVSAERPVIVVDHRDAAGLLATGFFAQVG